MGGLLRVTILVHFKWAAFFLLLELKNHRRVCVGHYVHCVYCLTLLLFFLI